LAAIPILQPAIGVQQERVPVRLSGVRSVAKRFLLLLAIAFFIRSFIGEAALVPTSSMEGTILVGDHILLNKLGYGPRIPFTNVRVPRLSKIQRGNIIAFHYPKDPSLNFLKRVAAVGGDIVEIKEDVLYVNQMPVREPYVVRTAPVWRRHSGNMPAQRIPAGHLFVLGDNRDNSDDSRFWGTVPEENVIGEPLLVVWSYDAPSSAWLSENPEQQMRLYSSIATHLFSRTRWWRTGILL
jgi:signal peptidase I